MGLVLEGLLVLLVVIAVAVAALHLVRRSVPFARLRRHNDVAGFIYAVVGVVYGVPLAFVLVAAWDSFDDARANVAREANDLADLHGAVGVLAEPTRDEVRARIHAYTHATLEHEWTRVGLGRSNTAAEMELQGIWQALQQAEPVGTVQELWYAAAIDRLNDLTDSRQMRLLDSRNRLPTAMWVLLIVGAVLTIGFSFLFGVPDARAHTLMVVVLAGLITIVLYLIAALEYPFEGIIRLETEAFEQILRSLHAP